MKTRKFKMKCRVICMLGWQPLDYKVVEVCRTIQVHRLCAAVLRFWANVKR